MSYNLVHGEQWRESSRFYSEVRISDVDPDADNNDDTPWKCVHQKRTQMCIINGTFPFNLWKNRTKSDQTDTLLMRIMIQYRAIQGAFVLCFCSFTVVNIFLFSMVVDMSHCYSCRRRKKHRCDTDASTWMMCFEMERTKNAGLFFADAAMSVPTDAQLSHRDLIRCKWSCETENSTRSFRLIACCSFVFERTVTWCH